MQWFYYLSLIFEMESKSLYSAGSQHDSNITGVLKDILSDSEFEMDVNDMVSKVLFLNDDEENYLRTLPMSSHCS